MSRKKKRRPRRNRRRGSRSAARTTASSRRAPTPAERLADQIIGLNDRLKTVVDLIETGFDVEDTREALRADLAPLEERGVKELPPDDTLLRKLNMRPFYALVYRPGSDHVHFSLATAIGEMRVGSDVMIDRGDPDLADEAMRLAIMIYGTLLEHSERTVEHGLHDHIFELSRPVLAADPDG